MADPGKVVVYSDPGPEATADAEPKTGIDRVIELLEENNQLLREIRREVHDSAAFCG